MKLQIFGYGFTFSGHFYRRRKFHVCEFKDCPARIPSAEIKYVIANRIVGSYSERFDSREDLERALRYFAPMGITDKRYEILECVKMMDVWAISDPDIPESDGVAFFNSNYIAREEHGCATCRACQVSCDICARCPKNPKEFAPGTRLGDAYDRICEKQNRESE